MVRATPGALCTRVRHLQLREECFSSASASLHLCVVPRWTSGEWSPEALITQVSLSGLMTYVPQGPLISTGSMGQEPNVLALEWAQCFDFFFPFQVALCHSVSARGEFCEAVA